ncbi:MAG: TolC family protein [Candidatus Omnitrophica bacterium]|nr:TolC family protein [Candidatus Omnitrophota bacterium]
MKPLKIFFLTLVIVSLSSPGSFSQESERSYVLPVSAEDVRLIAINNSLDIKLAQLDAKIKGTELSYKKSIFDTFINGEIGYTDDQRKPASTISGSKNITNTYDFGIDKKLKSGTDIDINFTNNREWTDSSFVSLNPYHNSEIEVTLTQPVAKNFFGLIDRGNIELVRQEIKNADLDSYSKIEEAIISAEKAYWKMVLAGDEFNIKKEILKKSIRFFNQYRNKLKIGLAETGDVLAAEANMHTRESELLMASNDLKTTEELLLLRLNLDNKIKLVPKDRLPIMTNETSFIDSLRIAFENRRDYISMENDIEAKKIKLSMKSNSMFPEIDLKATFATNGLDPKYYTALKGILEDSNPKYYVGVEFKYPLENNQAESEHEKAVLEKAKAIVNMQKTERQIISDIDEKFRNLSVNRINMSKMKRVENLQEGKLSQEEKRFKYGRSNSDTIIRYQEDLLNARIMTKRAYYEYTASILDLMNAEDSFLKYVGIEL